MGIGPNFGLPFGYYGRLSRILARGQASPEIEVHSLAGAANDPVQRRPYGRDRVALGLTIVDELGMLVPATVHTLDQRITITDSELGIEA